MIHIGATWLHPFVGLTAGEFFIAVYPGMAPDMRLSFTVFILAFTLL